MTGTLELLVGPSGVGKTSSVDGVTRSYRWTTRPIRPGEVDTRYAKNDQSSHGYFVTDKEFDSIRSKLCGVHRYPDPNTGYWYGLHLADITSALADGDHREQIVDLPTVLSLQNELTIPLRTRAIFAHREDIQRRILHRSETREEYLERSQRSQAELVKYLSFVDLFDDVVYSFPETLTHAQSGLVFDEYIRNLNSEEGFILEYSIGNTWHKNIQHQFGDALDALLICSRLRDAVEGSRNVFIEPELELNDVKNLSPSVAEVISKGSFDDLKRFSKEYQSKVTDFQFPLIELKVILEKLLDNPSACLRKTYSSSFTRAGSMIDGLLLRFASIGFSDLSSQLAVLDLQKEHLPREEYAQAVAVLQDNLQSICAGKESSSRFGRALETARNIPSAIIPFFGSGNTQDYQLSLVPVKKEHMVSFEEGLFSQTITGTSMILNHYFGNSLTEESSIETFLPVCNMLLGQSSAFQKRLLEIYQHTGRQRQAEHKQFMFDSFFRLCQESDAHLKALRGKHLMDRVKNDPLLDIMASMHRQEGDEETLDWILNNHKAYYFLNHANVLDAMHVLLLEYAVHRNNREVRREVEVDSLIGIETVLNAVESYITMFSYYEESMFRLSFMLNKNYLEQLQKIMLSDPANPLTEDNQWSYPLPGTLSDVVQRALLPELPSVEESFEEIKNLIKDIKNYVYDRNVGEKLR